MAAVIRGTDRSPVAAAQDGEDEAMIGTLANCIPPSMRRPSSIAPAAPFRVPALLPIGA
ncbi:hypothetical protein [Sphingomonas melonis]|uniref:Uncharacterized protein n=1 Tax=Sphingomonas melonis TaxID=152682 RepID=A0A7Y9FMP4_9SPHN|nr:hypothetical protein [Sphingomonas melonis]NYD90069.1 hypothetical protein [Sphingomonas melonis]